MQVSDGAYFSNYEENNGYRLFLKYVGNEEDPTDCACQLPVKKSLKKMYGWYARPVRQDGEDTWVRMADETTSNAVYNWDLNWACVKEAPPMSNCPGKFHIFF